MEVDRQIFIKQKLFQFRPHVMKKILPGVTGVRAEMRGGKAAQALAAGAAARGFNRVLACSKRTKILIPALADEI